MENLLALTLMRKIRDLTRNRFKNWKYSEMHNHEKRRPKENTFCHGTRLSIMGNVSEEDLPRQKDLIQWTKNSFRDSICGISKLWKTIVNQFFIIILKHMSPYHTLIFLNFKQFYMSTSLKMVLELKSSEWKSEKISYSYFNAYYSFLKNIYIYI